MSNGGPAPAGGPLTHIQILISQAVFLLGAFLIDAGLKHWAGIGSQRGNIPSGCQCQRKARPHGRGNANVSAGRDHGCIHAGEQPPVQGPSRPAAERRHAGRPREPPKAQLSTHPQRAPGGNEIRLAADGVQAKHSRKLVECRQPQSAQVGGGVSRTGSPLPRIQGRPGRPEWHPLLWEARPRPAPGACTSALSRDAMGTSPRERWCARKRASPKAGRRPTASKGLSSSARGRSSSGAWGGSSWRSGSCGAGLSAPRPAGEGAARPRIQAGAASSMLVLRLL